MKKSIVCLLGIIMLLAFFTPNVFAIEVGQTLTDLNLKDAEDEPATIPDFGQKVLSIIYSDPEAADDNDPYSDTLKAKNLDKSVFRGMGIANLKDTWKPNAIIRMIIRKKIEKYDATILTDPDHILPTTWAVGDCDDTSVVIVVGKDKKVKYFKKGALTKEEIDSTIALIENLIK